MAEKLSPDPEIREIFLRALREYSEECEAPLLTPGCPYSVEVEPGLRGCADECMDILGEHDAPPLIDETFLGDGISIVRRKRPRTRRAQRPGANAYDARAIYLEDKGDKHTSQWRLASILQGLIETASTQPPVETAAAADRQQTLDELRRLAGEHELDFSRQILPHLRVMVASSVFASLIRYQAQADEDPTVDRSGRWEILADEFLKDSKDSGSTNSRFEGLGSLYYPVADWATHATADQLLTWDPPTRFADVTAEPLEFGSLDEDGQWIMDRFTRTYLDQWSTESLNKEWLYLHGQIKAPCSPADMQLREVNAKQLSPVMADRLAIKAGPKPTLAQTLVQPALAFLKDGRRLEASALFEAATRREPNSAEAHNNLGFCRLPDDPAAALVHFTAALSARGGDKNVIDMNRILALAALGRHTSAIDLATAFLSDAPEPNGPTVAWLWDVDSILESDSPVIIEVKDSREYVKQIFKFIEVRE